MSAGHLVQSWELHDVLQTFWKLASRVRGSMRPPKLREYEEDSHCGMPFSSFGQVMSQMQHVHLLVNAERSWIAAQTGGKEQCTQSENHSVSSLELPAVARTGLAIMASALRADGLSGAEINELLEVMRVMLEKPNGPLLPNMEILRTGEVSQAWMSLVEHATPVRQLRKGGSESGVRETDFPRRRQPVPVEFSPLYTYLPHDVLVLVEGALFSLLSKTQQELVALGVNVSALWTTALEFAFFMQDSSVLLRVLELLLRMTTVPDGPNPGTVDVAGAALQELRELSLALCPGFSWPGRNVVEVRSTPLTLLPDYARQDILRIALSVHDRNILYVLCSESILKFYMHEDGRCNMVASQSLPVGEDHKPHSLVLLSRSTTPSNRLSDAGDRKEDVLVASTSGLTFHLDSNLCTTGVSGSGGGGAQFPSPLLSLDAVQGRRWEETLPMLVSFTWQQVVSMDVSIHLDNHEETMKRMSPLLRTTEKTLWRKRQNLHQWAGSSREEASEEDGVLSDTLPTDLHSFERGTPVSQCPVALLGVGMGVMSWDESMTSLSRVTQLHTRYFIPPEAPVEVASFVVGSILPGQWRHHNDRLPRCTRMDDDIVSRSVSVAFHREDIIFVEADGSLRSKQWGNLHLDSCISVKGMYACKWVAVLTSPGHVYIFSPSRGLVPSLHRMCPRLKVVDLSVTEDDCLCLLTDDGEVYVFKVVSVTDLRATVTELWRKRVPNAVSLDGHFLAKADGSFLSIPNGKVWTLPAGSSSSDSIRFCHASSGSEGIMAVTTGEPEVYILGLDNEEGVLRVPCYSGLPVQRCFALGSRYVVFQDAHLNTFCWGDSGDTFCRTPEKPIVSLTSTSGLSYLPALSGVLLLGMTGDITAPSQSPIVYTIASLSKSLLERIRFQEWKRDTLGSNIQQHGEILSPDLNTCSHVQYLGSQLHYLLKKSEESPWVRYCASEWSCRLVTTEACAQVYRYVSHDNGRMVALTQDKKDKSCTTIRMLNAFKVLDWENTCLSVDSMYPLLALLQDPVIADSLHLLRSSHTELSVGSFSQIPIPLPYKQLRLLVELFLVFEILTQSHSADSSSQYCAFEAFQVRLHPGMLRIYFPLMESSLMELEGSHCSNGCALSTLTATLLSAGVALRTLEKVKRDVEKQQLVPVLASKNDWKCMRSFLERLLHTSIVHPVSSRCLLSISLEILESCSSLLFDPSSRFQLLFSLAPEYASPSSSDTPTASSSSSPRGAGSGLVADAEVKDRLCSMLWRDVCLDGADTTDEFWGRAADDGEGVCVRTALTRLSTTIQDSLHRSLVLARDPCSVENLNPQVIRALRACLQGSSSTSAVFSNIVATLLTHAFPLVRRELKNKDPLVPDAEPLRRRDRDFDGLWDDDEESDDENFADEMEPSHHEVFPAPAPSRCDGIRQNAFWCLGLILDICVESLQTTVNVLETSLPDSRASTVSMLLELVLGSKILHDTLPFVINMVEQIAKTHLVPSPGKESGRDASPVAGSLEEVRPLIQKLLSLQTLLGHIMSTIWSDQVIAESKQQSLHVESPHPYPPFCNQTMTVRIPGAVFLEIRFDPRSSTADMNDTVQLFCVLDDECLPMHEVMWGHQHGGMGKGFPRSLILPGDAVRIEFTASSMELEKAHMWGFLATVTGFFLDSVSSHEDSYKGVNLLFSSLATINARIAELLITGAPSLHRQVEKSCEIIPSEEESPDEVVMWKTFLENDLLAGGLVCRQRESVLRVRSSGGCHPSAEFSLEEVPAELDLLEGNEDLTSFVARLSTCVRHPLNEELVALLEEQVESVARCVEELEGASTPYKSSLGQLAEANDQTELFETCQRLAWLVFLKMMSSRNSNELIRAWDFQQYSNRMPPSAFPRSFVHDWKRLSVFWLHAGQVVGTYLQNHSSDLWEASLQLALRLKLVLCFCEPVTDVSSPPSNSSNRSVAEDKGDRLQPSSSLELESMSPPPLSPMTPFNPFFSPDTAFSSSFPPESSAEGGGSSSSKFPPGSWDEDADVAIIQKAAKTVNRFAQALLNVLGQEVFPFHRGCRPQRSPTWQADVDSWLESQVSVAQEHLFHLVYLPRRQQGCRTLEGLRILRMLISEFKLDTAQTALWELLHSLSDPEGRPRHFLDGLSACGRHLSHLISQEFYALCEECLLLLRNPKSPPSLCQLILNMLRVPFRCQDFDALSRSGLFPTLHEVMSAPPVVDGVLFDLPPSISRALPLPCEQHFQVFASHPLEVPRLFDNLPNTIANISSLRIVPEEEGSVSEISILVNQMLDQHTAPDTILLVQDTKVPKCGDLVKLMKVVDSSLCGWVKFRISDFHYMKPSIFSFLVENSIPVDLGNRSQFYLFFGRGGNFNIPFSIRQIMVCEDRTMEFPESEITQRKIVQNLAFHTFSSLSDRYLASGTQLSAQGLDGLVSALESELKFSDSVDGSKYEGQDPPVAQPSISSGDPSKPVDNLTERSSVARHRSRAMQDNISRLTLHLLHKQIKRWYPKSLVRQVVSEDSDTVSVRTLVDVQGDSSAGHQLEEKTKELSALCDVSHQMASQALLRYKDDLLARHMLRMTRELDADLQSMDPAFVFSALEISVSHAAIASSLLRLLRGPETLQWSPEDCIASLYQVRRLAVPPPLDSLPRVQARDEYVPNESETILEAKISQLVQAIRNSGYPKNVLFFGLEHADLISNCESTIDVLESWMFWSSVGEHVQNGAFEPEGRHGIFLNTVKKRMEDMGKWLNREGPLEDSVSIVELKQAAGISSVVGTPLDVSLAALQDAGGNEEHAAEALLDNRLFFEGKCEEARARFLLEHPPQGAQDSDGGNVIWSSISEEDDDLRRLNLAPLSELDDSQVQQLLSVVALLCSRSEAAKLLEKSETLLGDLVEGILFGNTPEVQVRCVRLVDFLLRQANSLSSVEMALARVFQAVQTKSGGESSSSSNSPNLRGFVQSLAFSISKVIRWNIHDRRVGASMSYNKTCSLTAARGLIVQGQVTPPLAAALTELLGEMASSETLGATVVEEIQRLVVNSFEFRNRAVSQNRPLDESPLMWLGLGSIALRNASPPSKRALSVALDQHGVQIEYRGDTVRLRDREGKSMLLVDTKAWMAVLELRDVASGGDVTPLTCCRFCEEPLPQCRDADATQTCNREDCQALLKESCTVVHPCGHLCGGIVGEEEHLPCLRCSKDLLVDADDFCVICYSEKLVNAPTVQLASCGHFFHVQCVQSMLNAKWPGSRIDFNFMRCPLCKVYMEHPALSAKLAPHQELLQMVKEKCEARMEVDHLAESAEVQNPTSVYFQDPLEYAMDRYNYYLCFRCKKPYFGGERACDQPAGYSSTFDESELVCGSCVAGEGLDCPRHGKEFLEFKCCYCCSVAVWFCFGTTHFCDPCHSGRADLRNPTPKSCSGPEDCPLGVSHPPHGTEFALGCSLCRRN